MAPATATGAGAALSPGDGERSVTCKGDFDLHPSKGPLPKGAPPVCEFFRQLPDALETAAALDAKYGRNPDLEAKISEQLGISKKE